MLMSWQVLEPRLELRHSLMGYQVAVWLWELRLHGLSELSLEELRVERDPGLGLARATATLTAPQVNTLPPSSHLRYQTCFIY